MRFWFRESAGWLLVAMGVYLFLVVTSVLLDPTWERLIESSYYTVIGFVLFRGGIHLLKVAVAARVCMQAHSELSRPAKEPARRPVRPAPWEE